ncbi:MAG: hypothetical protein ACR2NX_14520 [Chthoniobacterales bacterium]
MITFSDGSTVSELSRIAGRVSNSRGLLTVLGRRGGDELRRHFQSKESIPNKLGGRKTGFWRQVANSVTASPPESGSRVRVSVTHQAFAQKVFGGIITAKRGEFLTIPVDKLSRGLSVAAFEHNTGITLFRPRKKGGALARVLAASEGAGLHVYYALTPQVKQEPDPEALPPRAKFNAAILDEATKYLEREIRGN